MLTFIWLVIKALTTTAGEPLLAMRVGPQGSCYDPPHEQTLGKTQSRYSRSIGTTNSTQSSGCAPGGTTAPPICRSRQCSGPLVPLRTRTTRFLDLSTRTSKKLWKKGARLKSNRPDKASTLKGQALNHLIQYQNGCFHSGISASILARS